MMFVPPRGMSAPDEYIEHLGQMDLASGTKAPYVGHCAACLFE